MLIFTAKSLQSCKTHSKIRWRACSGCPSFSKTTTVPTKSTIYISHVRAPHRSIVSNVRNQPALLFQHGAWWAWRCFCAQLVAWIPVFSSIMLLATQLQDATRGISSLACHPPAMSESMPQMADIAVQKCNASTNANHLCMTGPWRASAFWHGQWHGKAKPKSALHPWATAQLVSYVKDLRCVSMPQGHQIGFDVLHHDWLEDNVWLEVFDRYNQDGLKLPISIRGFRGWTCCSFIQKMLVCSCWECLKLFFDSSPHTWDVW